MKKYRVTMVAETTEGLRANTAIHEGDTVPDEVVALLGFEWVKELHVVQIEEGSCATSSGSRSL